MNSSDVVSDEQPIAPSARVLAFHYLVLAATLLSGTVWIVVFWGFIQLDLPVARFFRSLHVVWLEQAGDIGSLLGSGLVLVLISGVLFLVGMICKRPVFRQAGFEGLIAHAVVALIVQAIKHLIGRPRPRMADGAAFSFEPSWEVGFDSFPSGHASAAFAVATVLARHFPRAGWIVYSLAALVAVSRVVRGSHFLTDIMAGMSAGSLVGCVISNSICNWKSSLQRGLINLTPSLAVAFALAWITVQPSFPHPVTELMFWVGVIVLIMGLIVRLYRRMRISRAFNLSWLVGFPQARAMIGVGVALTTGSLIVTALAVLVFTAHWLVSIQRNTLADVRANRLPDSETVTLPNYRAGLAEVPLIIGLILSVWGIQILKGLLPLL